ncbi:putative transcriptional regulator with C-terminal CBS domains [Thiovulum sp. ES]|nr:putative transcriptional regulator with C-terminal CBS domains [Thiovulum sp. ES]
MEQKEENLVKKTCRELGINQKELANLTGFSEAVISRWNRGANLTESTKKHFALLIENSKLKTHIISKVID